VVRVAATYPSGDPDRTDTETSRPTLSSAPAPRARRSPWVAIAIAAVVVVVIAVVAYMLLYNGGTPSYGGGGGAGGGGMNDGGGYFILAFTGDAVRRVVNKLKR
jgi:hypothetical protein